MLLGIDGQAHYSTAQFGRKWTQTTDYCTWTIANEGRWSGNPCVKRVATAGSIPPGYISRGGALTQSGIWTPTASGVCGFAFKTLQLARHVGGNPGSAGTEGGLIAVMEGSSAHVIVNVNTDGSISAYRMPTSGDMELLATSAPFLADNTWAYIECKWTIDDATGSVKVRVNGLEVLSYAGPTQSTFGLEPFLGIWTSVRLLGMRSDAVNLLTCWLNDFYLLDQTGSGAQLRDFLGDVRVQTILPNGAGVSAGWTPNAGANYAAVDEVPGDDDTTYVSTSAAATRDSHAYQDIPTTAIVFGFQTCHLARRETAGSAILKPTVRSGGTTHDGNGQAVGSDTAYTYAFQPYDTNPVTSAQATAAEINAAEFGTLYV
jgi:hypothetical protein